MSQQTTPKPVALVTGGAKRIGAAISAYLAKHNYHVIVHYHQSAQEARNLVSDIQREGGSAACLKANLNNSKETLNLIQKAFRQHKRLDLLINNASVFEPSLIIDNNIALLERHFNVNFKTPLILMSEYARSTKKGHIINILDTHITENKTKYTSYVLSKKALAEATKMAALEFAPKIRVNAIAPGLILPPEKKAATYLNRLAKDIPLKRKGDCSKITASIQFLLDNDFLTGQILFNDGGEHLL